MEKLSIRRVQRKGVQGSSADEVIHCSVTGLNKNVEYTVGRGITDPRSCKPQHDQGSKIC